jgi:hypothetical protein
VVTDAQIGFLDSFRRGVELSLSPYEMQDGGLTSGLVVQVSELNRRSIYWVGGVPSRRCELMHPRDYRLQLSSARLASWFDCHW